MTRGIHLKQLRTTDLELLGLPDDLLPKERAAGKQRQRTLLAEVDPALARVIGEVRVNLEEALHLLEDALEQSGTNAAENLGETAEKGA